MPMRDAARAACVSRGFLRSWRCYPKLILTIGSLGIKNSAFGKDRITRDFISRVDQIMQNQSGMGVKTFILKTFPCSNLHPSHIDRWLEVAITPAIEEFELSIFNHGDTNYSFPFQVAGCMSSLKYLDLRSVKITGEELYGFLSNSCALEKIHLSGCADIICLKIPFVLQKLNAMEVLGCNKLEMIDSNAPNLSSFLYSGAPVHLSLGDAMQVTTLAMRRNYSSNLLYYASTKLPSITPNLQTLFLSTSGEDVHTPMLFGKFFQLKCLEIVISAPEFSPEYDFYSLIYFLDASPALETFTLRIELPSIRHDSIAEDSSGDSFHPRCLSECFHENLKNVMITGFCSAKSMIELTIHIINNTRSLECLTLDTTRGHRRFTKADRCLRLSKEGLVEAKKASAAIRRFVEGRVPTAVNLKLVEPCSKCVC